LPAVLEFFLPLALRAVQDFGGDDAGLRRSDGRCGGSNGFMSSGIDNQTKWSELVRPACDPAGQQTFLTTVAYTTGRKALASEKPAALKYSPIGRNSRQRSQSCLADRRTVNTAGIGLAIQSSRECNETERQKP
jgi:hypothetical protein